MSAPKANDLVFLLSAMRRATVDDLGQSCGVPAEQVESMLGDYAIRVQDEPVTLQITGYGERRADQLEDLETNSGGWGRYLNPG
jgi:hypothetical protein